MADPAYTPTAERLIILPRRGKPPAPGKRMGVRLSNAVTYPIRIPGDESTVRLIADVVIDDTGLRRVLNVQHHQAAEREARLITASETPMSQAVEHRGQLVERLGYPQWAVLHSVMMDLEKKAKRRTPHGRIRCEIYAVAEKG